MNAFKRLTGLSCVLVSLMLVLGCQAEPKEADTVEETTEANSTPTATKNQPKSSGARGEVTPPSDSDLYGDAGEWNLDTEQEDKMRRGLLKGKWTDQVDSKTGFEFTDKELIIFQNGNIISTEPYFIHVKCDNEACAGSESSSFKGWCFSTPNECYIISRLDSKFITYYALGSGLPNRTSLKKQK